MSRNQEVTVKTESMCEFAFLDKESYEAGLLRIREELDRKMVEFMRTQAPFMKLTFGKMLSLLW